MSGYGRRTKLPDTWTQRKCPWRLMRMSWCSTRNYLHTFLKDSSRKLSLRYAKQVITWSNYGKSDKRSDSGIWELSSRYTHFPLDTHTTHPTQKPVALFFEYLIKTYTNEGETVLDNCMGSGTTAIACINTNRNYIGFELDETYFNLANERIEKCKELAETIV